MNTLYEISLAQWSLHKAFFAGYLQPIDFPRVSKEQFGISAVEYVNSFFPDRQPKTEFMQELKKRCSDLDVQSLLIMCDGEGNLGDPDEGARNKAIENHYKWIDAAVELGCHSIRVNAQSSGSYEEQMKLAADGLAIDFAWHDEFAVVLTGVHTIGLVEATKLDHLLLGLCTSHG